MTILLQISPSEALNSTNSALLLQSLHLTFDVATVKPSSSVPHLHVTVEVKKHLDGDVASDGPGLSKMLAAAGIWMTIAILLVDFLIYTTHCLPAHTRRKGAYHLAPFHNSRSAANAWDGCGAPFDFEEEQLTRDGVIRRMRDIAEAIWCLGLQETVGLTAGPGNRRVGQESLASLAPSPPGTQPGRCHAC